MDATMATRMIVVLEDDLEGGLPDETVQFGIGGTYYEIDLNASNAAAFRRQLAPYIEHACTTGRNQGSGRADCIQPGTERGHPGVGQRPGHRAQRPRAHPGRRCEAVPSRHRSVAALALVVVTGLALADCYRIREYGCGFYDFA